MTEKTFTAENIELAVGILGDFDGNLQLLEREFGVVISARDNVIKISGEEESVENALKTFSQLEKMCKNEGSLDKTQAEHIIALVKSGNGDQAENINRETVGVTAAGKPVKAKTLGQKEYIEALKSKIITLGLGPAGTGKTYLAVAYAVTALKSKEVGRIILTRPAVEAGEKLGFLPGDLQEKVNPYLRPLYDALYEMLGSENFLRLSEKGVIEVAPLAYMRGRTLDNSYIILDEAQNTTSEQMKMFLTRLGFNSKMVITGDLTQIDLENKNNNGLIEAKRVLADIEEIGIVELTETDVVRHKLIKKIVLAYEKKANKKL